MFLCVIYVCCVDPTGDWRVYVIRTSVYAVPARSVVGNSEDNFLVRLFKHVERFLTTRYTVDGKNIN
jgi:hypothetical protein